MFCWSVRFGLKLKVGEGGGITIIVLFDNDVRMLAPQTSDILMSMVSNTIP